MRRDQRGAAPVLSALALCALAGALGCGAGEPEASSGPVVRDSAGVRVVENGLASPGAWQIRPDPIFTVGWDEAGPLFSWVQSGRILPDGGALVTQYSEGRILRLAPDGSVVETWGRKGEGPGEFQGLDAILLKEEAILVTDPRLRRVTLLHQDGGVETVRMPNSVYHMGSAILPDGHLLLVPGEGYRAVEDTRPEWVFETQPIFSMDLESGVADTLAELPHLKRWYGNPAGSPGPVQVKGKAGGFGEGVGGAVGGGPGGVAGGFAWARSDRPEVRWFDPAGNLVQVARWAEEPAPLTAEWRNERRRLYEEIYRSRGAEESFITARLAELEEGFDRHEGPLPYWDQLHVDRRGNVWLGRYVPPGEAPGAWRVVERDGTCRGWIDLPGVIAILDVTDDRVLGVRLNEFDEAAVMMFELIKG